MPFPQEVEEMPRAAVLDETVGTTLRTKMVALVDPVADMVERLQTEVLETAEAAENTAVIHVATTGGVGDDTAAWLAAIAACPVGGSVVGNGKTKITTPLTIAKSIAFGGVGATRTSNDNSDPEAGLEFIYAATSGHPIVVRPPNATNSRISPKLHDLLVRGNRNFPGATGGGGILVDGRTLEGTAVSGFDWPNVHVSEAFGDGMELIDLVYEGTISGFNGTDCGGRGFSAHKQNGAFGPGEIALVDHHTHDNVGGGTYLADAGSFDLSRFSSSRNTLYALNAVNVLLTGKGLQAESNFGPQTVILDGLILCNIGGLNVSYPAGYTGTGLAVVGTTTRNSQLSSVRFGGDCTWDISVAAGAEGVRISGYSGSGANRTNFAPGTTLLDKGQTIVGGLTVQADASGNAFDILDEAGTILARFTRDGDVVINSILNGSKLFFGAATDTNIFRESANVLCTDDNLRVEQGFGCNGQPPRAALALGAAATDLASVITLANNIRTALINNGIGKVS